LQLNYEKRKNNLIAILQKNGKQRGMSNRLFIGFCIGYATHTFMVDNFKYREIIGVGNKLRLSFSYPYALKDRSAEKD